MRSYIPSELRCTVFDTLHSLSHPGVWGTLVQCPITAHYVWPKIKSDIRKWAQTCLRIKSTETHCDTFGIFATPDAQFDNIHIDIDIVGRLAATFQWLCVHPDLY